MIIIHCCHFLSSLRLCLKEIKQQTSTTGTTYKEKTNQQHSSLEMFYSLIFGKYKSLINTLQQMTHHKNAIHNCRLFIFTSDSIK